MVQKSQPTTWDVSKKPNPNNARNYRSLNWWTAGFLLSPVCGFTQFQNMRKSNLEHETPGIGVKIPKDVWSCHHLAIPVISRIFVAYLEPKWWPSTSLNSTGSSSSHPTSRRLDWTDRLSSLTIKLRGSLNLASPENFRAFNGISRWKLGSMVSTLIYPIYK